MVLQNFIVLQEGIAAVMHFADHELAERDIVDPLTRREKVITILEFTVDRLGGEAVNTVFSVTSEKLAQGLQPWLEGKRYRDFTFIITRRGRGFRTEYEIQTSAR